MKEVCSLMEWIQRRAKIQPNEYDSIVEKIAKIRGVEDLDRFLNPSHKELHDPYLMKNIEKAGVSIAEAIKCGKKIVVSYDPDCDGITSATIMLRYLKNYTSNVDFVYGERGDGHGIAEMIYIKKQPEEEELSERSSLNLENRRKIEDADLLILVDSSSNDVEACKEIVGMDTEIIILDHHQVDRANFYALLVNPQQKGCQYPNKHLSGAGVVFKTIQVVEDVFGDDGKVNPFDYIDLVAVGMYADVMPVDVYENRYLIMHGMRNMKNTGLVRILKSARQDLYKINSASIGFSIAPMLNGVARMDRIKLAIDMLLSDDDKECQKIQREMKKVNRERKSKQQEITDVYKKRVDPSKKILIVLDEQSSKGFNGIVAQQLSEKFRRPVMVGRIHKGTISGSFRSYDGFLMRTFLQEFADSVGDEGNVEAMGHEPAGGFSIDSALLSKLEEYIEEHIQEMESRKQVIMYDFAIDMSEVESHIKPIERFNLLVGKGFPRITVRVNNISVDEVKTLGEREDTRKVTTLDNLELIKFRTISTYADDLDTFDTISAVGQLQMNEFFNFKTKEKICTPQIILDGYKFT
jgi:single-stranded-DNA-specific exonuclease